MKVNPTFLWVFAWAALTTNPASAAASADGKVLEKPVEAELCRWACAVAKRDYGRFLAELQVHPRQPAGYCRMGR